MKRFILLVAVVPALCFGWDSRSSWRIPPSVYKNLDFTVRAGVDRSSKIFSSAVEFERCGGKVTDAISRYRAAAAEWRKVQVQSEAENYDETVIAYSVFMQAYSKELARDRNDAVKLYSEVIDLYPDVTWVSVNARYRLGCTQISMGEKKAGNATISELLADSSAVGNPVIADAALMEADRLWAEKKIEEAVGLWLSLLDQSYHRSSRDQWMSARQKLMITSFVTGKFGDFETALFAVMPEDNAKVRRERIDEAFSVYYNCFTSGWWHWMVQNHLESAVKSESERRKRLADGRTKFIKWFSERKDAYENDGKLVKFKIMQFRLNASMPNGDGIAAEAQSVKKLIAAEKDPKRQKEYVDGVIDTLLKTKRYDLARIFPDCLQSHLDAAWFRYQIERADGKWKESLMCLDEYLSRKPSPQQAKEAKYIIAEICRDHINQRERAVKLYLEINDPPKSLWALQRTYRLMGKKKEAYQVLTEISSIFPKDAPEAVLTCARYYEEDGHKKKAISLYRQLMSHPEWKKSSASSYAHQALERFGIATGGAMINEVR